MANEQATKPTQNPPAPSPSANGNNGDGKGSSTPPTNGTGQPNTEEKAAPNPARKAIFGVIGVIVLIGVLIWGVRYYHYSQTHVATDDAYITGNLVNVSPIISGTLSQLPIEEGDTVKKGQLIARLDDTGQMSALRQAQAAYDAAQSQIPQAQISLELQRQQTAAAIQRAQAALAAQQAKTTGASSQVTLTRETVINQERQATGQVDAAAAQAAQARAQVATYRAMVAANQQAVVTAQHAAAAAKANVASAEANATRASRDVVRYAALAKQEAVTQQQYDTAAAAASQANAQLAVARQQYEQARSQVAQARVAVTQARAQLVATQKAADAAESQVGVARGALGVAQANLAQVPVQQSNVANNQGLDQQAQADLATARSGSQSIALRKSAIATAQAQAAEAKAILANNQVLENDTFMYAPSDGEIVRKAVNVGAALSPGQTIATMTQGNKVWVTANFKETQFHSVKIGQPVEVEVDAFPGKIFKGKVQSINEATGASTALLPPDNATGNFTKVVQRIPLKIEFVPASDNDEAKYARAQDILNLRQGESVTATIDISDSK